MLVGERRNGNLLVQLGPKLQAQPEELLRQRWSPGGCTEYLIRWAVQNLEDGAESTGAVSQSESKASSILMWMSAEEVYTNCPTLLGKRKAEGSGLPEEKASRAPDEGALREMRDDVRMLVQRAARQMSQSSGPDSSILNTIHVLSAYASIGSLAGVFKETGALDLLMKMLCNQEKQIRNNAGKMLRALASHDAGSRAHVLLSLSQQDGIEQHMDFESRYTLLQLFAETTSSEEHCISFEGIHLPQIPGKQLFSLVKRYLCVTSLLDQLSRDQLDHGEKSRLQRQFDFSMAMGSLICELVRVMGWVREREPATDPSREVKLPRILRSIFQPKLPACAGLPMVTLTPLCPTAIKKKQVKEFMCPSDFQTRNAYVDYIQEMLKPGMSVRMLEDYDEISAGDEGVFRQSNNGMPPVQVLWRSTGRTYWVHWHMVQILGSGDQAVEDGQEKSPSITENLTVAPVTQTFHCKPSGGMYALPYLTGVHSEECETLRQDEWWELLFFIRRLETQEQQQVLEIIKPSQEVIKQSQEVQILHLDEHGLIEMVASVDLAHQILRFMRDNCNSCVLADLQSAHIFTKYFLQVEAEQQSLHSSTPTQDCSTQRVFQSKKSKTEESTSTDQTAALPSAEKTDLQLLKDLLTLEGLQPTDLSEDKCKAGFGSSKGALGGISLDVLLEMLEKAKKSICSADALTFIIQVLEQKSGEETQGVKSEARSSVREKIVKMLVELLTNQMKEKMLVIACLQLTYLVMSKYDWRVLFATEGGVRAVLGCMQEHQTSAAVQHAGLTVLKVLTGVGSSELRGIPRRYTLNPSDAQVIKEIFSSIGSAASGSSTNLLRAIPSAISKLLATPGCFSAVHNGLLIVRMLIENHKALAEQLSSCELPSILQSFSEDTGDSMHGRLDLYLQKQLCDLLRNGQERSDVEASDVSQAAAVQDMDLQTLLTSLKESKTCRDLLPSLERCVCDGVYSLCCEVSELLTNSDFFLQLLSSLEQLRAEKRPQLSIYRILNKALDFYQEDVLPWHRSIEPSLTSLGSGSSDHEVLQEVVSFLYRLASTNKDCAVVMCRLGTKEILGKVVEKQSSSILQASELRDLLTDCEKYASLYQKMATSILAGCIQMVLGQIEEHRRSQQPINIPFFDVFLRNLCQGSSVEVKEDKCWEKIEVSSNPHRANKLTDGNLKSYWESNGSTGSHYINIFMHRGVVIRQLVLTVASEDSSYMPARVVVMGGENPSSINTELNSVNISSVAVRVLLLENLTRFWPIIQIKIKRCQQGGIDTRVRGLEVLGPKPTFWPVFKEQLCRRTFLFYTSRAHSWGQEICEKRENLLQLFSRLNRALSHEQEFAERFLVDDEAAQALGRTCWEALIAPLVQSITTPDDNVSPLSWLFTKYLENAQTFRRPKSRSSVFNSHVRRLTRLLVHVDTSLPDTEALKPPGKPSEAIKGRGGKAPGEAADGKTRGSAGISVRSSMAGIAACWQGVIQHQVQKFLEISWNNLDLVPKFCSLYLALRRAMEELFGQQTLFLLSLRQGFCEGLLHLSFLTALHVTEQFARYIDQRIQEIRTDSSNLHSMNQLQLFLEFVVFLSDLELANSFEHFYRHYLADRLLSLGPCWLENSVVDHIGICFPNRFPQQMLKNLQEAKELQKDQHLFSLQEFDTRVLSEDMEEEEVMEEDPQPLEEKEDLELQVSVLSPRCWAVSPLCYMDDPCKHFPECLSSSLERFTNFYSKSQYALSSEVSQLRRLQWTWLGNAELQYGELTLHVSTLQMFILLLFNQQEEISQQSILQSTGLSQILMEHALTPLIANGGILACNQKSGLLSLNDMVQVEAGPGKAFRLFPKQMYLNVEEDEGRTLERKRNIIFCLITQIMKVEKELHIDNLVFRVVEACQKWESGTSPKILSFVCSHTDVLSCIMHLISQGYVQRNEDSPHILEYISKDPSTPHKGKANILFQNSSRNKQENDQKSSPSSGKGTEQGVLETILLPMGRTLSQEEVWTLMSQMVTQVSDTLTVTPDVAQHLLIHCKWNVDLLLQKYTDDSELLLTASGLKVENSQPPDTPLPTCPVCVIPLSPSDSPPTLCCMHFCCKSCWKEYLTTRIEQNLVLNCTCPTTDCPAQPTSSFIRTLISSTEVIEKYEKALLRGFVESCSNLTWCTNPQGCDQVLCKEGLSSGTACAKCSWHSCFTCNFPEAHYPASCSHMSQWMDDGGFYEGMTVEAQSKHLTKLISKHCPSCQAPIEKNEGCLHMTCAKCNHGFCWRCLKPWKPTHKDYYNCSAMVSKAARQEKRFQDYNERCTFQHRAKDFAVSLRNRLSILSENLALRTLTLLITSCRVLEQSRKVLGYSCVYSYYNQDSERLDVLESQTENLEVHVSALQILLEDSLLQSTDLSSCVRLLKSDQYNRGLELVRRVQERLQGILQHSTQDFRVGYLSQPDQKDIKLSNVPAAEMTTATDTVDGTSESGDTAGEQDDEDDDEYVPEWHEEYDEDLDEDDFSYDEDGSENLEPDSFIFEDDDADAYE